MRNLNQFISLSLLFLFIGTFSFAQKTGNILGEVKDRNTKEILTGASVTVEGKDAGTSSDANGRFELSLPVGTYNLKASFIGYEDVFQFNIVVSSGNDQTVNFELVPTTSTLEEVQVGLNKNKSAIATDMITPLSVQQLTYEEIKSNPGGNFDVSKVVQTLPGVGTSSGMGERNDIIIRGGAPNENVYYLDGIEIPVLNHFQTQGSSGGAQGILNVSFIESLKLSSSAFDARYDNPLASTFVIKQRDGNPNRISGNARVSLTESVLTLEGPISPKTTFLASARRSYLSFLFQLIDLPIRPDFYDFQYKVTHKFDSKNTLTAIGLGAIDMFKFANTKNPSAENTYVLRSSPYINQWNYTVGFIYNRKIKDGFMNLAFSRNMYENNLDKFEDENKIESQRTMKIFSQEIENKLRWDINKFINNWQITGGLSAQLVSYNGDIFSKITNELQDSLGNVLVPEQSIRFNSEIQFLKYGAFAQAAKNLFNNHLLVSAGIRTDMNSFTEEGNNPLKTLSPRISLAYHLNSQIDITGSVGTYFKIPTYTSLAYKDNTGDFVNKDMDYIQSTHYVLGLQFLPKTSLRFTLEGFYKQYNNYPVSKRTGISLANQGGDYGSIGSEEILSMGKGETYGFEVYAQQKLIKNLFYVVSYTYVRSLFSGLDGKLVSTSWDNQHLLSATFGYKFKREWDLGLKYRYAGGTPYTPYDLELSQLNYQILGMGVLDYDLLNTKRLTAFSQLDLRIDKRFNFKNTALGIYIDIQNVLMQKNESMSNFTFKRNADNSGFETNDGQALKADGSNGIPVILENKSGRIIPSIGIIFEF